jgi:hypothetical protein
MHIALNMRVEDVEECRANGYSPFDALTLGYKLGITYTLIDKHGEPVALLGVTKASQEAQDGLIWLLGTPLLERYPMTFLRRCRPVLADLYEESGTELLWNHTHRPNTLHHKWLKWLGFSFIREVGDFYEFARLKG